MTFIENYLIGAGIATYSLFVFVLVYWMLKELKGGVENDSK